MKKEIKINEEPFKEEEQIVYPEEQTETEVNENTIIWDIPDEDALEWKESLDEDCDDLWPDVRDISEEEFCRYYDDEEERRAIDAFYSELAARKIADFKYEYEKSHFTEEECDIMNEAAIQIDEQLKSETEKERDEYKDKYLRAMAEIENTRKHNAVKVTEAEQKARFKVISEFIEVLDDMDIADRSNETSSDPEVLKKGFSVISKRIRSVFERLKVEPLDVVRKKFDTDFHEGIAVVPSSEEEKNIVTECLKKGYTIEGKVIRHAKVLIGSGVPQNT